MQKLERMPRIAEQLCAGMDLPPIGQRDNARYTEVGEEESRNYEETNYASPSEEDIWIFAEEINILRHAEAIGKPMGRHIDVATGPNLYPLLASLPYFREIVTVEFAPGNIASECRMLGLDVRTRQPLDHPEPLPRHWDQWMRIAAVLYNADGATGLQEMKDNDPEGYDKLLSFLRDGIMEEGYETFLRKVDDLGNDGLQFLDREEENPYLRYIREDNLQQALQEKVIVKRGDILNEIAGDSEEAYAEKKAADPDYIRLDDLTELQGTADYLTEHFASESVSADPRVVAHFKTNSIQLARQGAVYTTVHMGGTTGYETFNSSGEQRPLEELCATPGFFKAMLSPMMRPLSYGRRGDLINVEVGARVREGYDNMVLISGVANHMTVNRAAGGERGHTQPKFANGSELLRALNGACSIEYDGSESKVYRVEMKGGARPVFCAKDEVVATMQAEGRRQEAAGKTLAEPEPGDRQEQQASRAYDRAMNEYERKGQRIYVQPAYWDQFYEPSVVRHRTEAYRDAAQDRFHRVVEGVLHAPGARQRGLVENQGLIRAGIAGGNFPPPWPQEHDAGSNVRTARSR